MTINDNYSTMTASSGVIYKNYQTEDFSKYRTNSDEDTKASVMRKYDEDGNLVYEHFDEDKNGIFEHKISYLPNGSKSIESYHDNESGKILEMVLYEGNNLSSTTKYTYDEAGNMQSQTVYNDRGLMKADYHYSYDKDGNLVKKSVDKNGDGEIDYHEIYENADTRPIIQPEKSFLRRLFEFVIDIFKGS